MITSSQHIPHPVVICTTSPPYHSSIYWAQAQPVGQHRPKPNNLTSIQSQIYHFNLHMSYRPHIAALVYVVFHHYTVWDRNRTTLYVLLLCLVATYTPASYFGIKAVFDYRSKSLLQPPLQLNLTVCAEAIVYVLFIDQCAPVLQPNSIKEYWACLVSCLVFTLAMGLT